MAGGISEVTTTSRSKINNIAKPGCETHCGNVIVPYPFGIGNICSLDNSFQVTCDSTYKPPKLFLKSDGYEIFNISDSELRVQSFVTYRCYDQYGKIDEGLTSGLFVTLNSFTFSVKNKFIVIGCDDYGLLTGREIEYSSGCIGLCNKELDVAVLDTKCSGKGCCHTSIRKGLKYINMTIHSFRNHTNVWSFNRCGYAFLGVEGIFKFSGASYLSKGLEFRERIKSTIHVLIDWVIAPDRSCSDQATECKENSECYDVDGGGYRCRCNQGYYGNPYLDQGCQDFDECKDPNNNFCYGDCTNTPGGYKCTCPEGSVGNATTPNGCICPPGTIGDATTPNGCQPVAVKDSNTLKIIFTLGVGLGTAIILVLASEIYEVVQKRKERRRRDELYKRNGGLLLEQRIKNGNDAITRMFSARDLEKATAQYNVDRILGRGGQGTVYKGILTDGEIVAVKKSMESMLVDENQVESFINEVYLLCQISHKNVVKLLGCCLETEVPILVYEFVSNGDLSHFLHDESYKSPTLWNTRLQIAKDVAVAIAYMHCGTSVPIYHRDIKSSNILLDENFNAKLSDFGIFKPEYFQSYQYAEKSDVYSFGTVLVELLTEKRPIFSTEVGESKSLATLDLLSEDQELILETIDAPKEQLLAFAKLAKECLNLNGRLRPTMKEVGVTLEAIISNGKQASTSHSSPRVYRSSIKRYNSL